MPEHLKTEQNFDLRSDVDARKEMVSGTFWRGAAELFRAVWASIVVLVLATIVGPEVFGLVGMTDVLVQFFNIFLAMGFDAAIIQQERMTNRILSSLFWLNIALGVVLTLTGMAISPLLAWFYREPKVTAIFFVLSFTFVLQSFSVVQRGLLARNLSFRALALVDIVASLTSSLLAIAMALMGGSYWSLVVLQLSKHIFTGIGYWLASPWRPRFLLELHTSMSSLQFSGHILLFNILNFAATRSDIILVGRFLGAEQLGFYLLANQLIFRTLDQILSVINRTLFPILSAVKADKTRVREIFVRVIVLVFSGLAPFILLVGLLTPVIIPFQMGELWQPLIPILWIWCLGGFRRLVTQQNGVLFLVLNRPDLQWKYQLISTPIVTLAVILGVKWGAIGVSLSFNIAQLAVSFLSMHLAFSLINLDGRAYLREYKSVFIALIVVFVQGSLLTYWLTSIEVNPYIIGLLVGVTVCGLYATVLYGLDERFRQMWQELCGWFSRYYSFLFVTKS